MSKSNASIPAAPQHQEPPPDEGQMATAFGNVATLHDQPTRRQVKPSMNRRAYFNDYRQRRIYMITMMKEAHVPAFGELNAELVETETGRSIQNAQIIPSPLGMAIHDCWLAIPHYHPEVSLIAFQLMPDHFHGLLFVTREMEAALGKVIIGFKIGCRQAFCRLYPEQSAEASRIQAQMKRNAGSPGFLFQKGYNDSILVCDGQLDTMVEYIYDNPRRLAIRRLQSDFFRVYEGLQVGGHFCSAQGNLELLRRPCVQVRVSRKVAPELLEADLQRFLSLGRAGTVLVSPCISPGEKRIMREAFNLRLPQIVLLDSGINPRSKPYGERFDACAEGRLLLLSPFPCRYAKKTITREECQQLNELAYDIEKASGR